jgi:hypothetical protein
MILPNKNPYSFGNSWRGTVVQADLIEWEEWLRFFWTISMLRKSEQFMGCLE